MVHSKLNERETNPNPHINFITALPVRELAEQEDARQLLRALAAQVRPVMKSHGFSVNSFEEYEHNAVFAGRNWNAGETVEIVLRRPDGSFLPTFWLMSTLCHELAHIKHMNHGTAFQSLWSQLRTEVRSLQDKGYYGDGYWSSGIRLADSARVSGQGIKAGDLPEYMCGGAQKHKRPAPIRRHRIREPRDTTITASSKTGRQTARRRKAGVRVTSKNAFTGEGVTLLDGGSGQKGTGFRKQAASKRAREERALAIERRILALQAQADASTSTADPQPSIPQFTSEEEFESDEDAIAETDSERRQTLISSEQDNNLAGLKSGTLLGLFEKDFCFGGRENQGPQENHVPDCDLPVQSGSTSTTGHPNSASSMGKRRNVSSEDEGEEPPTKKKATKSSISTPRALSIGKLIQSEINLRKKESLGMAPVKGGGRTLGARTLGPQGSSLSVAEQTCDPILKQWECLVCTL